MTGVLGIFDGHHALRSAVPRIQDAGLARSLEAFSPFLDTELISSISKRRSRVHYMTLAGSVTGGILGFVLTIWTALQWPLLITGGKPIVSIQPFLVIVFTLTILLGSLGTWSGFLWMARKARQSELPYDSRFTDGHFGLWVGCEQSDTSRVAELLRELGAVECRVV